jgi:hypothetical protein
MPALRDRRLDAAVRTPTLADPADSRGRSARARPPRLRESAYPGAAPRSVRVRCFTGPWYMTQYGYLPISSDGR